MDEQTVKTIISGLLAKIEHLESEQSRLSDLNAGCAETVRGLLAKVEEQQVLIRGLQSRLAEPPKPANQYRKRPAVMRGRTVQSNVGCGPLYITLNEDESGKPFEVFFKLGKSGSCQQSYLEALGVAMSVGLRYGADPQKYVDKFEGMRCPNPKMRSADGPTTLSCADGISQGLAKALALALPGTDPEIPREVGVVAVAEPLLNFGSNGTLDLIGHNGLANIRATEGGENAPVAVDVKKAMRTGVGMCPKCSGPLVNQGGCISCLQSCGWTGKCS